MNEAIDVLRHIDQLRRELSGYHGHLKAHNDLQRHCDNQRERLAELEGLYKNVKQDRDAYKRQAERFVVENVKLRELVRDVYKAAHMLCEAWDGSCSKEADGMSLHSVCPIGDTSELCVFGKLDDRMRELGIEAEE